MRRNKPQRACQHMRASSLHTVATSATNHDERGSEGRSKTAGKNEDGGASCFIHSRYKWGHKLADVHQGGQWKGPQRCQCHDSGLEANRTQSTSWIFSAKIGQRIATHPLTAPQA